MSIIWYEIIHKNMKKKIIFFCPSIEIGGVEKNLYKVVNFFSSKNEDVSLITFNKKRPYSDISSINILFL